MDNRNLHVVSSKCNRIVKIHHLLNKVKKVQHLSKTVRDLSFLQQIKQTVIISQLSTTRNPHRLYWPL